jgi:cytochrome c553
MGEQIYIQKGCIGCHGVAGVGTDYAPPLAGLDAEYIIEQLEDFQDGTRMNLTMEVMSLQVEGLESIVAAYLASRTAFLDLTVKF